MRTPSAGRGPRRVVSSDGSASGAGTTSAWLARSWAFAKSPGRAERGLVCEGQAAQRVALAAAAEIGVRFRGCVFLLLHDLFGSHSTCERERCSHPRC